MSKYKRISVDHKRVELHRFIMEKYLGRKLLPNEIVHHKNKNIFDNRLENLELMTRSEHTKYHMKKGDLYSVKNNIFLNRKISPNDELAWCSGCQKFLPKSEFTKDSDRWNGLDTYCKKCKKRNR